MDSNGRQRGGKKSKRENGSSEQGMHKRYQADEAGSSERENGRCKEDPTTAYQNQLTWMIPAHILRDPEALTMKFVNIITERDNARDQRDLALAERKAAFAERDKALLLRDTAFAERNVAVMELDNTMQALYHRQNTGTDEGSSPSE